MGAIALFASIAGNIAMVASLRKRQDTHHIDPLPLEVRGVSGAVTEANCSERHDDIRRRLDEHTNQIDRIWHTMRDEDEKTRIMIAKGLTEIERALGRIEGKLSNE